MIVLNVQERDVAKKPAQLRESGLLPAVFYGPKEKSTPISVDAIEFAKIWKDGGETTIVTLSGIGDDKEALIHSVDAHPVTGILEHADLYVIERGKMLEVSVPVEFEGEAPAEKVGGVVVKVLHEIDIKVRPSELPQHFTLDLSKLENIGDQILASDIKLPASGELMIDPDEVVVSVTTEAEEEEDTTPAEEEGAEEGATEESSEEGSGESSGDEE